MKPGYYLARAVEWKLGVSDNGKDYIAVKFSIEEGEEVGRQLTWRGFFTEKTRQRTIEALRYCGWEGTDFASLDGLDRNLVQLDIDEDEYEGKKHWKVNWVNRLGGLAVKNEMTDQKRREFAARMKGEAMKVPTDLAKAPPAPANDGGDYDGPPPHENSDLPF
jgi:hypothetical protein